jgi:hypothetical protein
MTGARGASLDVPHGLAGILPREPRVSRSLAQVEPWDEILPLAESRGGTPPGERALRGARRTQVRRIRISVRRRSAFLFSFFLIVAQGADREMPATTAGILWRRSVRRAEKFPSRDEDSGADRIARTMSRVIAGLDPAISMTVARLCHLNRDGRNKSGHDNRGNASLREAKRRSNPGAACVERWIASRSLSSGRATSRGPVGSQ